MCPQISAIETNAHHLPRAEINARTTIAEVIALRLLVLLTDTPAPPCCCPAPFDDEGRLAQLVDCGNPPLRVAP